jgi:hypothetical protein
MRMDNPVIQTLMLFAGAYIGLNILHEVTPADKIVTALAGLVVAVIWMAHYERPLLYSLSLKPGIGPVIVALCKMVNEQPPSDPATEAAASGNSPNKPGEPDSPKLLLHSSADFASASRQLKETVRGHNDVIEALMDQIRLNVQLRDNSAVQVSLPPIGVFALIGKPGLGKKLLATEIGYKLYKGSSVSLLDVSDPGVRGGLLIAEARSNPFTTFVLENFHNCSAAMQEDLLSIVSGAPQVDAKTGSKVSFRNCFFFLLIHRDEEFGGNRTDRRGRRFGRRHGARQATGLVAARHLSVRVASSDDAGGSGCQHHPAGMQEVQYHSGQSGSCDSGAGSPGHFRAGQL